MKYWAIIDTADKFTVGIGMPGPLHTDTGLVQVSNSKALDHYKDYNNKYEYPNEIIHRNIKICANKKKIYKKSKRTYKKINREFQRNQRIIKKQQFKKLNHKRNYNFKLQF